MKHNLPLKNCLRRPMRTLIVTALVVVLSFCLLAGFLVNAGLKNGLTALEARLGADVMVVPSEAGDTLNAVILQGNTGYFYMDQATADAVVAVEGVAQSTEQLYLASLASSCCSAKVQFIGFDKESDFVIYPWLTATSTPELGDMEILVGSQINAFAGDCLMFYGVDVTVAGRLETTGTYMDTAVFADQSTIQILLETAAADQSVQLQHMTADTAVSCVLLNVADGYSPQDVAEAINQTVEGVEAIYTQSMIGTLTSQLSAVTAMMGWAVVGIWLIALAVMALLFTMLCNERSKEFAVLRILGASRPKLFAVIWQEAVLMSAVGSFVGVVLSGCTMTLVCHGVEDALGLPFSLPSFMGIMGWGLGAMALTVATASLSSGFSAYRMSRVDAALILRGEN